MSFAHAWVFLLLPPLLAALWWVKRRGYAPTSPTAQRIGPPARGPGQFAGRQAAVVDAPHEVAVGRGEVLGELDDPFDEISPVDEAQTIGDGGLGVYRLVEESQEVSLQSCQLFSTNARVTVPETTPCPRWDG